MAQRIFVTVLAAALLLILGAGSAGQSAWAQSAVIIPAAHSSAVPDGLSGIWHGTFQELAGSYRDVRDGSRFGSMTTGPLPRPRRPGPRCRAPSACGAIA